MAMLKELVSDCRIESSTEVCQSSVSAEHSGTSRLTPGGVGGGFGLWWVVLVGHVHSWEPPTCGWTWCPSGLAGWACLQTTPNYCVLCKVILFLHFLPYTTGVFWHSDGQLMSYSV